MATFGDMNVASSDGGGDQDSPTGTRFQAPASGTITDIYYYFYASTATGAHANVAVYADDGTGSNPTTLLGQGTPQAISTDNWVHFPGFSIAITNGNYYWIVFMTDNSAVGIGLDSPGTWWSWASGWNYSDNNGNFPNSVVGDGSVNTGFQFSSYAVYTPAGAAAATPFISWVRPI